MILQEDDMQGLSRHYDQYLDIEEVFDCMRIEGDFDSFTCNGIPIITGMYTTPIGILQNTEETSGYYPDDPVSGGTDMILTITGECFGDEKGQSYVTFDGAIFGFYSSPIEPLDKDYVGWQDDIIAVCIPSYGVNANSYAGSVTSGELTIDFSFVNRTEACLPKEYEQTFPNHTFPVSIADVLGTKYYRYDPQFELFPGAVEAFERALNEWKCIYTYDDINSSRALILAALQPSTKLRFVRQLHSCSKSVSVQLD